MKIRALVAVVALSIAPLAVAVPSADAAPKAKAYKNCTALNKVYPHGVGMPGAKDKHGASSKAVTNFTRSAKVYKLNDGKPNKDLDRDNDKIACEKH